MMFGMAAASTALDLVKSLTSSQSAKTTSKTNFSVSLQSGTATNAATSSGQGSLISPDTMNALFAAQSDNTTASMPKSPAAALSSLFKSLDADGSGQISKSEFENALGAGGTNVANADKVFGKLDTDQDGSVSMDELASALKPKKPHKPHGEKGGPQDALMQMLDAANAAKTTNSDGSTTSTMTLADGSTVTMTTPATASASTGATRAYSAIEQMLQRQMDMLTKNTATSSAMSVNV